MIIYIYWDWNKSSADLVILSNRCWYKILALEIIRFNDTNKTLVEHMITVKMMTMTMTTMRKEEEKKTEKSRSCVTRITYPSSQAALTSPDSRGTLFQMKINIISVRMISNDNFTFWFNDLMIKMVCKYDDKNIDDFQKEQVGVFILWHGANIFLCITVLFSSTELSANAVVHICELCIHIFFTIFTEFSIKYTALARLYTFDMKQTCFLHHGFLFFNRLSRALCQCSGLQYYVFLCVVFLFALLHKIQYY